MLLFILRVPYKQCTVLHWEQPHTSWWLMFYLYHFSWTCFALSLYHAPNEIRSTANVATEKPYLVIDWKWSTKWLKLPGWKSVVSDQPRLPRSTVATVLTDRDKVTGAAVSALPFPTHPGPGSPASQASGSRVGNFIRSKDFLWQVVFLCLYLPIVSTDSPVAPHQYFQAPHFHICIKNNSGTV